MGIISPIGYFKTPTGDIFQSGIGDLFSDPQLAIYIMASWVLRFLIGDKIPNWQCFLFVLYCDNIFSQGGIFGIFFKLKLCVSKNIPKILLHIMKARPEDFHNI